MPINSHRALLSVLGCLLVLLMVLGLDSPRQVLAQEDSAPGRERPKIGLALGGGGARGAAHVAVLQRLEELRIPIDYIAGTSIGSIVGGLYASGLSPDDMSDVITSTDWIDIFNDSPSRQDQPFRRKEEGYVDLFKVEVGISRGGVRIPAGLVAGQKFEYLLRGLTLHVAEIEDFDQLGVPYRAVATDLDTGDPAILGTGDLADAMRASMAIPGFFTPAIYDGKFLVDGGAVQNVPVQTVREMGADIIIAVDVGTPPGELSGDNMSLLSVAGRTVSVLTAANTREALSYLTEDDFLLVPDLTGVSTLDFAQVEEAERRGVALMDSVAVQLSGLSVSEEEFARYLARQRAPATHRDAQIRIDRIEVVGESRVPQQMIMQRMTLRPGDDLDLELLQQDLRSIYEIGEFEQVDFHIRRRGDETVLEIEAREKFWGPDYFRFGMRLEGNLKGSGGFLLNFLHRKSFINSWGAEWRNLLSLGDVIRIRSEFDQPLGYKARFFLGPILHFTSVERGTYLDPNHKAILDGSSGSGELDLGYRIGNDFQVKAGAQFGYVKAEVGGLAEVREVDDQLGLFRVQAVLDDLDSVAFPRYGSLVEARLDLGRDFLGSSQQYDRLLANLTLPFTRGSTTLTLNFEGGYDFGGGLPLYEEFILGGLFRISGLDVAQLRGDQLLRGGLVWMQRLGGINPLFGNGIYGGVSLEAGNAIQSDEKWQLSTLIPGGAVYAGVDSSLGPLFLAWGAAEGGRSSFYFILGQPHRLGILH